MTWEALNQAKQRFLERQKKLEEIAQIVAFHPEWQEQEPKLKQLLHDVLGVKVVEDSSSNPPQQPSQ